MGVSARHERRVGVLETLAALSGCRTSLNSLDGFCPDVLAIDSYGLRLFVGDAKATESVGNTATRRRLRRYLRALPPWTKAGFGVRVALCTEKDAYWERHLVALGQDVGLSAATSGSFLLQPDRVSWLDLCRPSTPLGASEDALLRSDAK